MSIINSGSLLRHNSGYLEPIGEESELDLYEELSIFTNLSPEQRQEHAEQALETEASVAPPVATPPTPQEAVVDGIGFEVVEMYKTRPLVMRPGHDRPGQPSQPQASQPQASQGQVSPSRTCPSAASPSGVSSSPIGQSRSARNVLCPTCGTVNAAEDLFCESCGAFLDEPEPASQGAKCSDCGASVQADEIFCPSCGLAIADA